MQPAEAWSATPACATCFYSGEPQYQDVLSIGAFANVEETIQKWEHVTSDTDGCWDLVNPTHAKPQMALTDLNIPVYSCLKALTLLGWRPEDKLIVHKQVDGVIDKIYDRRNASSKRSYYQV